MRKWKGIESYQDARLINVLRENSEWLMDSGCNRHVTSHLNDYVSYQRFSKPGSAEIANKEELLILGMGIVIIKHIRTDGKHKT